MIIMKKIKRKYYRRRHYGFWCNLKNIIKTDTNVYHKGMFIRI
jgi:hypothetical protein